MALQKYTKEWLEELCKNSSSYSEVLAKAGRKQGGGTQATLKKKIQEFNIDVSHFCGHAWNKGKTSKTDERIIPKEKYTLEEVFCKNSQVTQKILREYTERHKIIPYKCHICSCDGTWQNGQIKLELHHQDGDNTNNEISNLIYLCPNCHALTENYRGKNKKNTNNEISEEAFINALQNTSNIRQALIMLGLAPKGANYDRAKKIQKKYQIVQK